MSISFKNYVEFVSLDEADDEQITEIFGLFQNNSKIEKLKAERDALKKKMADREEARKKDAMWANAKKKADDEEASKLGKRHLAPSGRTSHAAQGKRAERDFLAQFEGYMMETIQGTRAGRRRRFSTSR